MSCWDSKFFLFLKCLFSVSNLNLRRIILNTPLPRNSLIGLSPFAHFSSPHSIIQYLSHNIQYLLYYTVVIWIIIACFANSLVLETRMRVDSLEASWCRGKKRSHTKFMLNTLVMEADFIIGS